MLKNEFRNVSATINIFQHHSCWVLRIPLLHHTLPLVHVTFHPLLPAAIRSFIYFLVTQNTSFTPYTLPSPQKCPKQTLVWDHFSKFTYDIHVITINEVPMLPSFSYKMLPVTYNSLHNAKWWPHCIALQSISTHGAILCSSLAHTDATFLTTCT